MTRTIRIAEQRDVPQVLALYEGARTFMRATGNAGQWGESYPALTDVEADRAAGSLYVCTEGQDEVLAVFFFAAGPDPTYAEIEGAWQDDGPYHVMHRVAACAGTGAGKYAIAWACGQARSVRIDTHEDNGPMRHVLKGLGFTECGTIRLANGSPRIAYQYVNASA